MATPLRDLARDALARLAAANLDLDTELNDFIIKRACTILASGTPPTADGAVADANESVATIKDQLLTGHNARDFARTAAVCRGWTYMFRDTNLATDMAYKETVLQIPRFIEQRDRWEDDESAEYLEWQPTWTWSPCGLFILAAVFRYSHTQFYLWRASTGALVSDWWHYQPHSLQSNFDDFHRMPTFAEGDRLAFSRDSAHVVTLIKNDHYFVVWSVLDGRMVADNELVPAAELGHPVYGCPDFGVPGSASDGLIGFGSMKPGAFVDLWTTTPMRRRCRVDLNGRTRTKSFAFSKDGSSFAAAYDYVVGLYDVASLTRLGTFNVPNRWNHRADIKLSWLPSGLLMLCMRQSCTYNGGNGGVCMWDVACSSPEPKVTWYGPDDMDFKGWSSSGTSYFKSRADCTKHPIVMVLEERRADNRTLVRRSVQVPSIEWRSRLDDPIVMAPDERALLTVTAFGQARVIVFPERRHPENAEDSNDNETKASRLQHTENAADDSDDEVDSDEELWHE